VDTAGNNGTTKGLTRPLERFSEYSRKEAHDIFAPETPFTPQSGTWGIQGIIEIPERPKDFVFFVTLGQSQGDHRFAEGITEDGVLTWQSQPRQRLKDDQIQQLIHHNEDQNSIYLFFRTHRDKDYVYVGNLKYLSHDPSRENPVYFEWQIADWEIPGERLQTIGINLLPPYKVVDTNEPLNTLIVVEAPSMNLPSESGTARRFRGRKSPDYAQRDAKNRGLGLKGEELALSYDRNCLTEAGRPDLAAQIRHVSVIEGDGTGYDISSFSPDGKRKYIEVKTTEGDACTDFFISANEVEFSRIHSQYYCLYRVFEFDTSRNSGKVFIHRGSLAPQFELSATQFRVKLNRR
jgi:hypothetical protein